jgi:hypothetical protein
MKPSIFRAKSRRQRPRGSEKPFVSRSKKKMYYYPRNKKDRWPRGPLGFKRADGTFVIPAYF